MATTKTKTAPLTLDLVETEQHPAPALQQSRELAAPPANDPMSRALAFFQGGGDPAQLQHMVDLNDRFEAREAEKAFNAALAAFKAEGVTILKTTNVNDGPLKGKKYANLADVVLAVTPALSKHGLSASWKLTKDEPGWMEVTCTLRHVAGHAETISMGGEPDTGPGRNKIQSRASTTSYLERYTLLAILGMAASDADDDGNGGGGYDSAGELQAWKDKADLAINLIALNDTRKMAGQAFSAAKDVKSWNEFKAYVDLRRAAIQQEKK